MNFLKFPSLTNRASAAYSRIINRQLDQPYYATEKIDGTNVQVVIDLNNPYTIKYGKRSKYLTEFKDHMTGLNEQLSPTDIKHIQTAWQENPLSKTYPILRLYGEYFGYQIMKHNYNLNKNKERKLVLYTAIAAPEEIAKIDNNSDMSDPTNQTTLVTLSYKDLQKIIPENFQLPIVRQGTLRDLMNINVNNEPESEFGPEKEGLVYRPLNQFTTIRGMGDYPVIKHKLDKYLEVKKQRNKEPLAIEPANQAIFDRVYEYITEQRLNNIISKGDLTPVPENITALIDALRDDVANEFARENPDVSPQELRQALKENNKNLGQITRNFVLTTH